MSVNPVLESARAIAGSARHVTISNDRVTATALKLWKEGEGAVTLSEPEGKPGLLEPTGLSEAELLNWIFLLDTLNFCFWSDEDTLFTVEFRQKQWMGYRALVAALSRAVEGGVAVYEPSFYGQVTLDELEEIFKSQTHVPIPLLEQRLNCLHEVAAVLDQHYGGRVSNLVESCHKDAVELACQLATIFPCYRDTALYGGRTVFFLKRAQIFAADLWDRFGGKGYGEFTNIDQLTMFADYRVPQSLQYFGVLHYSNELMTKLQDGVHLPQGCAEEVEIRGCSIWAVEMVKERLLEMCSTDNTTSPAHSVYSVAVDYYLWNYAKSHSKLMTDLPIHRTHTIFY